MYRLLSTRVWIRLGNDFWLFPYFCTPRCSTVDSCTNLSLRGFGQFPHLMCSRILRHAWFNSGYTIMHQFTDLLVLSSRKHLADDPAVRCVVQRQTHVPALVYRDLTRFQRSGLGFCADFTALAGIFNATDTCACMLEDLAVSMLPAADIFGQIPYKCAIAGENVATRNAPRLS